MSTYITKNYFAHGGNELVVGGKLTILETAEVTGLSADPLTAATADTLGGVKVGTGLTITDGVLAVETPLNPAENQEDTDATTVAGLKEAFNGLLAKLKAAGLMETDDDSGDGDDNGNGEGGGSSTGEGGDNGGENGDD